MDGIKLQIIVMLMGPIIALEAMAVLVESLGWFRSFVRGRFRACRPGQELQCVITSEYLRGR